MLVKEEFDCLIQPTLVRFQVCHKDVVKIKECDLGFDCLRCLRFEANLGSSTSLSYTWCREINGSSKGCCKKITLGTCQTKVKKRDFGFDCPRCPRFGAILGLITSLLHTWCREINGSNKGCCKKITLGACLTKVKKHDLGFEGF